MIKILSDSTINKIAAGEVIERPASVVKELVENSIDAGSTKIDIILERAGKNLIIVSDNGHGMSREDLEMSVQRHATSKLDENDLLNISSFGFRGEALPSIGAISKFKVASRERGSDMAYALSINGGVYEKSVQIVLDEGTTTWVRDLFFSTPARLKFLRSDKTELMAIIVIIKKIALGHPHISFTLTHEGKELIKVKGSQVDDALQQRITGIMGEEFSQNSVYVDFQREGIRLSGYTSIPTYNKAAAEDQFLFINNRPVKDKILSIALKVAYQDFLARDRHPVSALFLNLDPHLVDVNVHPAKTEVRFHDPALIRQIFSAGIREALESGGQRVSTTLASTAINYMQPEKVLASAQKIRNVLYSGLSASPQDRFSANEKPVNISMKGVDNFQIPGIKSHNVIPDNIIPPPDVIHAKVDVVANLGPCDRKDDKEMQEDDNDALRNNNNTKLGMAKAQLHGTYIISQTEDSIIITDQHAAHERLGYEKIKEQLRQNGIIRQRLLIPEIVELSSEQKADIINDNKSSLFELGLSVKKIGEQGKEVIVSEIPALLGDINITRLINDLADHLESIGENIALTELIEHVTETYACHYAIRSGRILSVFEMNSLLRQMEETPFSGQCNHGRPTYVKLELKDIEKLFGRR